MAPLAVSNALRLIAWVVFILGVATTLIVVMVSGFMQGLVSVATLFLASVVTWGILMGLSALIAVMTVDQ